MPNLMQLRLAAREIFDEALHAVDAGDAVRRAVRIEGSKLTVRDTTVNLAGRKTYSIAIGKAALPMASALDQILREELAAGIVSTNASARSAARIDEGPEARKDAGGPQATMPALRSSWRVFQSGHPEPNEQSLAAARACFDLLKRADEERALVLFLISGGGSAMLEWPISDNITLADLRAVNRALVNSGASINEINAVRRALSAVKGGRLAACSPNSDLITLIVSDVPIGNEWNVASGPTLKPPTDAPDPREVIDRYDLRKQLPNAVLRAVDADSRQSSDSVSKLLRKHFLLLDNSSVTAAATEAAQRRGFAAAIAFDVVDQPIREGCAQLLIQLDKHCGKAGNVGSAEDEPNMFCLVSGGEFACPVRGDGMGGRNLETALRLAIELQNRSGLTPSHQSVDTSQFVALCAGTDGIDGNSPAAGGIIDDTTIVRARGIGLDPQDFLNRSDTYSFFVALGDAIATGPTGTNVRDLRILLRSRSQ